MVNSYQKALQKLWTGVCDVYVYDRDYINPANGRNEAKEVLKQQGVPCRLSFKAIPSTTDDNEAALVKQSVKLFFSKEVTIPPGAKLVVTQEGTTAAYAKSGRAAVYRYHQEIQLELFKEYA